MGDNVDSNKKSLAYNVKFVDPLRTLTEEEVNLVCSMIETHMGQWNEDKRSDIVLPKPTAEPQELVHLADHLASRKCLNMDICKMHFGQL